MLASFNNFSWLTLILVCSLTFHIFSFFLVITKCSGQKPAHQQYFRIKPQNVNAVERENIQLNCEIGNLAGLVQWSKDGFLLGKCFLHVFYSTYVCFENCSSIGLLVVADYRRYQLVIPNSFDYDFLGTSKQFQCRFRCCRSFPNEITKKGCQISSLDHNSYFRRNSLTQ